MQKIDRINTWCAGAAVLLLLASGCAGNPDEPVRPRKTEVVVIAAVHQPTEAYDGKVLYSILEELRPGVILTELPPAFYNDDYSLKDFESSGLELPTVRRYAARNGIELRPFDIEGRNRFYREQNWFERSRAFTNEVGTLYREEWLSKEGMRSARKLYHAYNIRDAFRDQPPRVINSPAMDRIERMKVELSGEAKLELVEREPELAEHREYIELSIDFWERRNERMVANIVRWAAEFPRHRIVVLTGFEHAYYLRRGLSKHVKEAGFVQKYHWEITEG
jgi:hypothetical protein